MNLFQTLEADAERLLMHAKQRMNLEVSALGHIDENTKRIVDTLEAHLRSLLPDEPAVPSSPSEPTPVVVTADATADTGIVASVTNAVESVVHTIENLV